MKPIKKFSQITKTNESLLESANLSPEALAELVQKLGYNNIEEVKKEKALLSKLEALLKEFSPKQDVSEDDAEDIEDDILKMGEPKSLEDKDGEKEEDKEVGAEGEVAEDDDEADEIEKEIEDSEEDDDDDDDSAKEIEKDTVEMGEPEEKEEEEGEEVVTKDQEVTAEVPEEGDDEESGEEVEKEEESEEKPVAKRRIMTFEDFIQEEETINKNVSYRDDDEEEEDYAEPVADSEEVEIEDEEEVEENTVATQRSIKSFSQFVSESYMNEEADNGPELKDETPDDNGIAIPVAKGDGPESAAGIAGDIMAMGKPKAENEKDGEELVTDDQPITKAPETSKDEPNVQGTVVVKEGKVEEKEIKSDSEFEEYAMEILKSAHGEDFDEAKAKETIDGLKSKYKGDYGAMVGALQSSMG